MNHTVNLAVQVLPLGISKEQAYSIIDEAIISIQSSGLKYEVCPFETVIEGPYSEVMKLLDVLQASCHKAGAKEILINMKLHRSFEKDLLIIDKTGKYRDK
jgi:uncharacterized protein YqgV (UPF0045/DUF77 family)